MARKAVGLVVGGGCETVPSTVKRPVRGRKGTPVSNGGYSHMISLIRKSCHIGFESE